jgi:hypothetical protein
MALSGMSTVSSNTFSTMAQILNNYTNEIVPAAYVWKGGVPPWGIMIPVSEFANITTALEEKEIEQEIEKKISMAHKIVSPIMGVVNKWLR